MKIFLGHEIRAPGGDAPGAVVERANDVFAGGIGAGFHPVVAGGGSVNDHRSVERGDAAVVFGVEHRGPFAVRASGDFDDRAAVGRHFDVNQLAGHIREAFSVLLAQAGEHHFFVRIFVVNTQQAARVVWVQGDKTDIVVVVAELPQLGFRRLLHGVEVGRIGKNFIAPAQ